MFCAHQGPGFAAWLVFRGDQRERNQNKPKKLPEENSATMLLISAQHMLPLRSRNQLPTSGCPLQIVIKVWLALGRHGWMGSCVCRSRCFPELFAWLGKRAARARTTSAQPFQAKVDLDRDGEQHSGGRRLAYATRVIYRCPAVRALS